MEVCHGQIVRYITTAVSEKTGETGSSAQSLDTNTDQCDSEINKSHNRVGQQQE